MSYQGPAATGYCQHGRSHCEGDLTKGIAGCLPGEFNYCAHGVFTGRSTTSGEHRCPYCRGVTRMERNRDTYRKGPIKLPEYTPPM
jgi:hypothetical protein